jgi:tRNA threonylcarbamoyladenosine biosynthesis protein TsaE
VFETRLANPTASKTFSQDVAMWFSDQNDFNFILLEGDLGVGKTTFSKVFISNLSNIPEAEITSPTFQIMEEYPNNICHFDLYRVESEDNFIKLGFQQYLEEPYRGCIEWPNYLVNTLPKSILISFSHTDDADRIVKLSKNIRN